MSDVELIAHLRGWFGYVQWANTYLFKKKIVERVAESLKAKNS